MFTRESRYAAVGGYEATSRSSFRGIQPRPIHTLDGFIEHTLSAGERLDQLAAYYYNDSRLWWRILDANPEIFDAGELAAPIWHGRVILIPQANGQDHRR